MKNQLISFWKLSIGILLAIGSEAIAAFEVKAQITPDNTLGAETSIVNPINNLEDRIDGGALRGSNLFHSFLEFNIIEGRAAYFSNPAQILNIFSRVTGSNPSHLFGKLGVLGNANLFFINPNGIIFGKNASLDVRGSFFATTAPKIIFPDGNEFSALNPQGAPVIKVEVKPLVGVYFEGTGQLITNSADLAVGQGQNLTLLGKKVTSTGSLTAPGGTVQVLGTESVTLSENARIDVSSETQGGTVLIGGDFQGKGTVPNAASTFVGKNVSIKADALTNGNGGKVIIWADGLTSFYGNISAKGGSVSGNGGLVEVSGKEQLIFRGDVNTSAINGYPGTLLLDPKNIVIANGSPNSSTNGTNPLSGNNANTRESVPPTEEASVTIYESDLERLSGDNNLVLQATNEIRVKDLTDNALSFAPGNGSILMLADADSDGLGSFVMEDTASDTLKTNGRNIAITGASLILGSIETFIPLPGDAGQSTDTALVVSSEPGGGPVTSISGTLYGSVDADLYKIYLTGDKTFSATTANGSTNIDTQLFLFDANGRGIYQNDDTAGCNCYQSTLPAGVPLTPTVPGIYYLAISGFGISPVTNSGEPIFLREPFEGVNRLTDAGAAFPLGGWNSPSESDPGKYTINLTGVLGARPSIIETTPNVTKSGSISLNATHGNISAKNLNAFAVGAGKGIALNAIGEIILNGIVTASAGNLTDGGDISLLAKGNITLNPGGIISASGLVGGDITITSFADITVVNSYIVSTSYTTAPNWTRGDIKVSANSIFLKDGASISSGTFGKANAGNVRLQATNDIAIDGVSGGGRRSGVFSRALPGSEGKGGNIQIDTKRLQINNGGVVSVSSFGSGDAGELIVKAQSVEASGVSADSKFPSGIGAASNFNGDGGKITIETESLRVSDGALITSSSKGGGIGGNIQIRAGSLTLDKGTIAAETTSNTGGDIDLQVKDLLLLRDRSQISTTAGTNNAGGDGGNININAGSIVAIPRENSDITANAFTGNGGQISINAQGILGIKFRPQQTPLSDITASSTFGNPGTVEVNALEFTTVRDAVSMPQQVEISFFSVGCQGWGGAEFFNIGRGGKLPDPAEPLDNENLIVNWIDPITEEKSDERRSHKSKVSAVTVSSSSTAFVPACAK